MRAVGARIACERLQDHVAQPDERAAFVMLEFRVEGGRNVAEDLAIERRGAADVALGPNQRARGKSIVRIAGG